MLFLMKWYINITYYTQHDNLEPFSTIFVISFL